MGDAGATHQAGQLDLWSSTLTILRLILGWACASLALLNLAMGLRPPGYAVFHVVMLVAGAALLALGMLRKHPGRGAFLTAAAVTGAGLLVSALTNRGYPFRLSGAGLAAADLFFWACVGFFALLLVTMLRPDQRPTRTRPAGRATGHAERRHPAPDRENVRGLP
jgi:hypothetical protein